jgi:PPK2 family polyphosphate:nucleotide phosphotransferase
MDFANQFRVKPGSKVRLSDWDPDYTGKLRHKASAEKQLADSLKQLDELQYRLYAESRRAILIVLQGMDCGGKDGTIRHVMTGMNPQGCRVTSFKEPTPQELAHDFLWRIHRATPRNGEVGIFNRSHYEDVLVVRVHKLVPQETWSQRYHQINEFEKHLADCNVHILKFFLHISRDEQLKRLKARLDDPTKLWKISQSDFAERKRWDEYVQAYEDAIGRCATRYAPWYIIPANHKWFRNLAVAQIIVRTLKALRMKFPEPTADVSAIKIV